MSADTRPSAGRRFGYLVAAAINAILLELVNGWPGWQAVPFLTPDAADVVTLVNLSLVLGIGMNLAYLVRDPAWLKALGEVLTTGVSLAVMIRLLQVFPFDFGDSAVDWGFWVTAALWVLIVATGIAVIVQVTRLVRILLGAQGAGD